MKLVHFQTPEGNFGDDLNVWIWNKLIPSFRETLPFLLFVGIGTILDRRVPYGSEAIIFGTGHRPSHKAFSLSPHWKVYGVRGPLTANRLGLHTTSVIGDPAYLVAKELGVECTGSQETVGFIPHLSSVRANMQGWELLASDVGVKLISPCNDFTQVVSEIASCDRIVTESLHGAIIADSLRIPWLSISSMSLKSEKGVNSFKWSDWCGSLGLDHIESKLPVLWKPRTGAITTLRQFIKFRLARTGLRKCVKNGLFRLSNESYHTNCKGILEERLSQLRLDLNSFRQNELEFTNFFSCRK